jgi:phosphoglycerate dehydrogenase-like enzyme
VSGIHLVPIAERILAMMLAFRARLPDLWQFKQRKHWPDDRWGTFSNPELRGSTVGIVGYGAIGGEVARQTQALGMRVLALSRSGQRRELKGYLEPGTGDPDSSIPEQLYPASGLLEMLPQCDHVVMLAPLTTETQHMIGQEALAAMKPTAYFYNYGRGALVDEPALIAALQNGRLAGVGLDVFDTEPLPADNPLWELPNVIISPHVGGMAAIYNDRATNLFAENLRRYIDGEPLFNLINRELGY